MQSVLQSVLQHATRPNGAASNNATPSSTTSSSESVTTSATVSGSSTSSAGSSTSAQENQSTRSGAHTQPTTSTHTRSSAHVHYAPRGSLGFNLSPMMSSQPSFDPLLPCRSHHIDANSHNRRIRHPAGPLMQQRTRSASVPPRGNGLAPNPPQNASRPEAQASSARSSPSRRVGARPTSNVDFEVSTHVDVVPMIMTPQGVMGGVVAFGSPRTLRPNMGASGGQNNAGSSPATPMGGPMATADPVEPSLAAVLGSLQSGAVGGGSGSQDGANMVSGLLGIMNEIRNAVTAGGAGGNQTAQAGGDRRTISAYLEGLPDYTYVEGESLLTDLLMLMARNTTFADLVSILMGSTDRINGLQAPLREFVRRYVLVPPNDDEHDLDAAVLHLVDMSYHHFEEMAREANVKQDLDFAETLHSFMAANLSSLAETILNTSNADDFGRQFR